MSGRRDADCPFALVCGSDSLLQSIGAGVGVLSSAYTCLSSSGSSDIEDFSSAPLSLSGGLDPPWADAGSGLESLGVDSDESALG